MNFKCWTFIADTIFMIIKNMMLQWECITIKFNSFKTLFKFDAINITLGLKYLRISPDHGTAINLIGKNKANAGSLLNSIRFINKYGL